MPLTEDHVREELKKVIDPELFVNIVDLGLIYTVDIKPHAESATEAAVEQELEGSVVETSETADSNPAEADASVATGDESERLDVFIEMTLTSPMCPAGPQLISQSKAVVSAIEQVANVEVKVVLDPPWTPDKMTDEARDQLGIF